MTGAGHEVHREKPLGEVRARLVEDCPGARVDVMSTFLTGESLASIHRVKLGFLDATAGAGDFGAAVVHLHQLSQASRVVRILGLKLFEGVLGHGRCPYLRLRTTLPNGLLAVKG